MSDKNIKEQSEQGYSIQVRSNTLTFRTTSFRAEKGSMLHSGIYNRELTASLASGAVLVAIVLGMIIGGVQIVLWHYIALSVLFFTLFVLFRLYIFYEAYLEVIVNKLDGTVSIFRKGLRSKRFEMPMSDITGIRSGFKVFVPENPDGIQVTEKIALQHGTVIPGFGEVKEFYTVHLECKGDEFIMLFASQDKDEAQYVLETFKKYIGGGFAKTD